MPTARPPLTSRTAGDGPPLSYRAFVPPAGFTGTPLVAVHGRDRRSACQFRAFLPAAVARGIPLIAPVFPVERFAAYQTLAGVDGPLNALTAFEETLADASLHLGIPTGRIDLVGFSGGAQFAHRFTMLAPARVRRVVVASAGWYTYLDEDRPFPRGVARGPRTGGRPVDVAVFLQVPLHVLVGERDVERDENLRTGGWLDRRQGPDRLTRALRWLDHLEETAHARGLRSTVSFDLLTDTAHSFTQAVRRGGLVAHTVGFLYPTGSPTAPAGPAPPDRWTADPSSGPAT
jgi:pimeloyl-ACP methyl ester carboxylesterase